MLRSAAARLAARLASASAASASAYSTATASFTKKRANELRTGAVVALESGALAVIEKFAYTQGSGRQLGIVQATLRGVGPGGSTVQARWRPGDDVTVARLPERACTLLYREGGSGSASSLVLMESDTFEQLSVPASFLDPVAAGLLPDGAGLLVTFDPEGAPIAASPAEAHVTLAVAEAAPAKTGAAPGSKSVVVESGATVRGVPQHIKVGDSVVVDLRDGSFVRRA